MESVQSSEPISGTVLDEHLISIPGAVVRIKTTEIFATTDANGKFIITDVDRDQPLNLTAWAEGYYIGGGDKSFPPGTSDVQIILKKFSDRDHPDYPWVSAFASAGASGNCENCHSVDQASKGKANLSLPFDEWIQDAHALSVRNTRFLTMYLGQDTGGNQSPQTRYASNIDYGRFPLRYDPTQPYFGPGFKLDFPTVSGNCAACHAPAASVNAPYATNPTQITGVGQEGSTCDFCHKVLNVRLDPKNNLPYPNMPGVLSFELRRPPEDHQFFAGPFDDVAPGEDTFAQTQTQSQFCAPCHFGSFWNVQIYNSYGEWLASPYSDPSKAKAAGLSASKTCQDCHMPAGLNDHFARLDKGGQIRDPKTIFSHKMLGVIDQEFMQNAVSMTVDAKRGVDELIVTVKITNDQTGHHVPTDSPLRQMILLVQASDLDGKALAQIGGAIIPEDGGTGNISDGYYSGLPGKIFAKTLIELWTEVTPSGAYWNPTRILSDNRIPALSEDISSYVFKASSNNKVNIDVMLIFRRAFKVLIDQKGWNTPDILMERETFELP